MKTKSFFFWGTVCCCLFCFLQIWYPFYFYYVEQLQVFPLTWACFEETCRQPGGLACWLGGFLLQFYHLPLGGALVSTGLFLGIGNGSAGKRHRLSFVIYRLFARFWLCSLCMSM